jgi:peptidyl-prolyl cis-trans isomerase C
MRAFLFNLKTLTLFAIFLAILGLSCERKSSDNTDAGKSGTATGDVQNEQAIQAEPDAAETTINDIAVTVNGTDITEAELERAMKPQLDAIAKQAASASLPPTFLEQYKKQIKPRILSQLINEELLNEKVKEANIAISDEEVIKQLNEYLSSQPQPLSLEDFKKKLEERGLDFEQMKEDVRRRLSYEKLMTGLWEGKVFVTEEEAKKYYDENPKRFETPEEVAVSHILIKPDPIDPNCDDPNEAKEKSKAAAKAKAEDLLKQIKDGADFAELAKANSACPSAKDGGDLGFFPRGQTTPPFEKVAFELELGQISDVVETSYGYHIIQKTGYKDASVMPFEQVKKSIITQLVQKQQKEFVEDYIDTLKSEADIVYPPGKEPPAEANTP